MRSTLVRREPVLGHCERYPEHYSCVGCPFERPCFENVSLGIGPVETSEAKGACASPVSQRR